MKRVLMVSPYVPWPLRSGGRIRIAHLARELARSCRVGIVAGVSADDADADLAEAREALGAFANPVVFVPYCGARAYRPFFAPSAARVCAVAAARVTDVARATATDIVHVEHSYALAMCERIRAPIALDEHNREVDLDVALAPSRARGVAAYFSNALFERRHLDRCSVVFSVSKRDAMSARRAGARLVSCVPNGVDLEALAYRLPSERSGDRVLFTGTFAHPPNVEAACWLARAVWPRVLLRRPNARLLLVGHAPPAEVRALAGPSIAVAGSVASVAPYFDDASVYAAAVRAGAGTNLKTLEAAAAGLALVATPKAIDGHPLDPDRHALVASDARGFADALVRALADPAASDARAARARERVATCTWAHSGVLLREAYATAFEGVG